MQHDPVTQRPSTIFGRRYRPTRALRPEATRKNSPIELVADNEDRVAHGRPYLEVRHELGGRSPRLVDRDGAPSERTPFAELRRARIRSERNRRGVGGGRGR